MHNFRKVLLSFICVLLVFALVSVAVIGPFLNSEHGYYQDHKLRQQLAGSLDCLVVGASHGLGAFDTQVLDRELDCCSYNLSAGMMTMNARYYFVK